MTDDDIPANPSVLNTTVLSNFAYIDQLWVVTGLSGICAVPVVREELGNGVDDYPYLQSALDTLETRFQSQQFRTQSQTERQSSMTSSRRERRGFPLAGSLGYVDSTEATCGFVCSSLGRRERGDSSQSWLSQFEAHGPCHRPCYVFLPSQERLACAEIRVAFEARNDR